MEESITLDQLAKLIATLETIDDLIINLHLKYPGFIQLCAQYDEGMIPEEWLESVKVVVIKN